MTKWKLNLKSIKSQNVNSYYSKNWKVITIYLIIITVIIEIIVKMTVTLMIIIIIIIIIIITNNNKQYFHVEKQTLIQNKSDCPSILNLKRQNNYTHIN